MPCAGRIYQQLSTLSGPLWMLARSAITLSTSQIITVQFQYLPVTEYNLTLQNQLCQKYSIHFSCIYFSFFQSGQGKQKKVSGHLILYEVSTIYSTSETVSPKVAWAKYNSPFYLYIWLLVWTFLGGHMDIFNHLLWLFRCLS